MSEDLNKEKSISKKYNSVQIVDEMKTSYLSYAMSVIISRALPDARDGLKPFIEELSMQCIKVDMTGQNNLESQQE